MAREVRINSTRTLAWAQIVWGATLALTLTLTLPVPHSSNSAFYSSLASPLLITSPWPPNERGILVEHTPAATSQSPQRNCGRKAFPKAMVGLFGCWNGSEEGSL